MPPKGSHAVIEMIHTSSNESPPRGLVGRYYGSPAQTASTRARKARDMGSGWLGSGKGTSAFALIGRNPGAEVTRTRDRSH